MVNHQSDMKKLIRLVLTLLVILLAVKLCSDRFGSVISLPGGLGKENTEDSGGWFKPKGQTEETTTGGNASDDISVKDLERELGIGKNRGSAKSGNSTPVTPSASSVLSFRGIPMTGSLSAFLLMTILYRSCAAGVCAAHHNNRSGCK